MRTLKQVAKNMADAFTRYGLWKGGGSGGSSALSEMTDVTFTDLQINDILKYNGSVWVNGNDLHEYSTEEKVVGKWVDGKDIYEKVINVTTLNVGNNVINFNNLNNIISYSGFLTIGDAKRNFPYLQNGTVGKVVINEYYNDRIIVISNWKCSNVHIIIQYTKTE